jgi:long-subunit acyl-CoA synthetase (AMP-forming)
MGHADKAVSIFKHRRKLIAISNQICLSMGVMSVKVYNQRNSKLACCVTDISAVESIFGKDTADPMLLKKSPEKVEYD